MSVREMRPMTIRRSMERSLLMVITRGLTTCMITFAGLIDPNAAVADETEVSAERAVHEAPASNDNEFDFSEFQFTPSTSFEPTEPDSLFHSGSGRVGRASYRPPNPDESPVIDGDEFEQQRHAEPIDMDQAPIEIPPIPGRSIDEPGGQGSPTTYSQTYHPEDVESLNDLNKGESKLNLRRLSDSPYQNYRVDESSWSWIPGSGDDFGWFSLLGSTYKPRGNTALLDTLRQLESFLLMRHYDGFLKKGRVRGRI